MDPGFTWPLDVTLGSEGHPRVPLRGVSLEYQQFPCAPATGWLRVAEAATQSAWPRGSRGHRQLACGRHICHTVCGGQFRPDRERR